MAGSDIWGGQPIYFVSVGFYLENLQSSHSVTNIDISIKNVPA